MSKESIQSELPPQDALYHEEQENGSSALTSIARPLDLAVRRLEL